MKSEKCLYFTLQVLRKKLEGSREELAKMEHELRGLQTAVTEKNNSNDRLTEEIGDFYNPFSAILLQTYV